MEKLKFKPISDLHIDIAKYRMPESDDDKDTVLLLAGDLAEGKGARSLIESLCDQFKFVVYCLGNHEFFNREYHALISDWREAAADIPNFHFLHDNSITIGDVRIMGGCLWTNFNSRDWFAIYSAKKNMNDFRKIRILNDDTVDSRDIYKAARRVGRAFHPDDAANAYDRTVAFLEEELAKPWEGKTLVMTHHLPSELSIHPRYKTNKLLNYAYFSSLEWLMEKHQIDVWVHGHTHYSVDYMLDAGDNTTRIISNARGYVPYEKADETGFDPSKLFDL